MRNIVTVIDQMLAKVPATEADLILTIEDIKDSCYYTAPEAFGVRWESLAYALQGRFPEYPTEGWGKEVVDIFMDKK